jgi:hypothetical protein
MVNEPSVENLKDILRKEVDAFCRQHIGQRGAVSEVTEAIRQRRWKAVLFGGAPRSLLISRFLHRRSGRPRDLDIVIQGQSLEVLSRAFEMLISRETRFGGLQLRSDEWHFDVWPLERTWAILEDGISQPDFSDLPRTTFLNVEAVAIELWPMGGSDRKIYSGDDQFFRAVIDRVVEVNRVDNPFPDLCVVRSLIMAHDLDFRIGSKLAQYIASYGPAISEKDLENIQNKHYGHVRITGPQLRDWIQSVSEILSIGVEQDIRLPKYTSQ